MLLGSDYYVTGCDRSRDEGNGVARIFFWGGPVFRDLRRPTRFGGGGG